MRSKAKKDACSIKLQFHIIVTARNGAAVIVRQDDDRLAVQAWPEHPLAGDVEIIAIDEREHAASNLKLLERGEHHTPDR